jgi:hypothetical protein
MAEVATLEFKANTSGISRADKALKDLNATGQRTGNVISLVDARIGALAASNQRVASSFTAQKGAIQQASFQMQDFFVQVGAGQSALTAFAQQGPQFASIFGAGGAVVGALIAVTAVIAGPFLKSLFDTKSATDQLSEAIKSLNGIITETDDKTNVLSDAFAALAQRSAVLSQSMVREALLKVRDALQEANEEANSLANGLSPSALGGRFDRIALYAGRARDEFLKGTITLAEFNDRINTLFLQTPDPSKQFRKVREELADIAEKARVAAERRDILLGGTQGLRTEGENENFKARLEEQRQIERLDYEAEQARQLRVQERLMGIQDSLRSETQIISDSTNEQLAIVNESARLGIITKQEAFALELQLEEEQAKKLRAIRERETAYQIQMDQAALTAKTNFATQLGSILQQSSDQNSAAAKAGFLLTQGVQVVQAINNANLAYSGMVAAAAGAAALAGPGAPAVLAAGLAQAEIVRGLGYATAAMIAGSSVGTVAARSQGGQVRPGQAYRVGEFGPETLVMGSNGGTITPAANDANSKINLVTNVKVIGGNQNAAVTNTTTQVGDKKFVQDIVVDLMANQNSPARNALHKTSNVRPVGQR